MPQLSTMNHTNDNPFLEEEDDRKMPAVSRGGSMSTSRTSFESSFNGSTSLSGSASLSGSNLQQFLMGDSSGHQDSCGPLQDNSSSTPKKKKKKKDSSSKKRKKKFKSPTRRRDSQSTSSLTMDTIDMLATLREDETADMLSGDEMFPALSSSDDDSCWGDNNQWEDEDWNTGTKKQAPSPPIKQVPPRLAASLSSYQITSTSTRAAVDDGFQSPRQPNKNSEFALQRPARRRVSVDPIMLRTNAERATAGILANIPTCIGESNKNIMDDLQSFVEENMSVLTDVDQGLTSVPPLPSRYNSRRPSTATAPVGRRASAVSRRGSAATNSGPPNEVPHELLVNYMMAMGANRAAAEGLALNFAAEQKQPPKSGQDPGRSQSLHLPSHSNHSPAAAPPASRHTRPPSTTLSKLQDAERDHYTPARQYHQQDSRSIGSFSVSDQSNYASNDDSYFGTKSKGILVKSSPQMVEAMPVQDVDLVSELPIVYADTTPVSFKHLILHERPVRRLLCLGLLAVTIAVIGAIIYFAVVSKGTALVNTAPISLAPSMAPTLINDEIFEAATVLSGADAMADPMSPQFKAVSWMSSVDDLDGGAIGGQAFIQRYALTVVYFSFKGENWINQEKWLTADTHECEWSEGIYCQYDETSSLAVSGFDATRNNLQGTIPLEIGLLKSSESFRIPKNNVKGTIPESIGKMTKLSVVDLSDNALSGPIPSSFDNVQDIIAIDLSKNQLNSSIPAEINGLKNLRTLALRSNKLTGPIPSSINNLTSLVTLDLRHNQISGALPLTLDSVVSLDNILLDYNRLSGQFPPVTAGLTSKQTLGLSHNQFSGNIDVDPSYLLTAELSVLRLQHVDISYNMLEGTISPLFGFLPSFRFLDFSGNNFVGTFPSYIGYESIEHLGGANNAFTGTIPVGYPTLTHLDFSNNQLSDGLPEELCEYPDLEFLILSGNQLEGTIPSCLTTVTSLRALEMHNCSLAGPLLPDIGILTDLSILDLSDNVMTNTIPTELGNLKALKLLDLQHNSLAGSIPSELGDIVHLQKLDLTDNHLTGTVPVELETLPELEQLLLRGNIDLSGVVPSGMCESSILKLLSQNIGCNIVCDCCNDTDAVC